jgi:hypothetical protein
MRRALDWLVVDEGGRTAGVVPFGSGGMGQGASTPQGDQRSLSDMCVKVMDALRGRAAQDAGESSTSASDSVVR